MMYIAPIHQRHENIFLLISYNIGMNNDIKSIILPKSKEYYLFVYRKKNADQKSNE